MGPDFGLAARQASSTADLVAAGAFWGVSVIGVFALLIALLLGWRQLSLPPQQRRGFSGPVRLAAAALAMLAAAALAAWVHLALTGKPLPGIQLKDPDEVPFGAPRPPGLPLAEGMPAPGWPGGAP